LLCDFYTRRHKGREITMGRLDLEYLAKNFEYKADDSRNSWRILKEDDLKGDCEDYALTALYIETGSMVKFWKELIIGSAKIKYCKSPSGGGHAILQYKGMYIDNWQREYVDLAYLIEAGYEITGINYLWLTALIKVTKGKFSK